MSRPICDVILFRSDSNPSLVSRVPNRRLNLVPSQEFILFATTPSQEPRHKADDRTTTDASSCLPKQDLVVTPPKEEANEARHHESSCGEKNPILAHLQVLSVLFVSKTRAYITYPKNQFRIRSMPTVSEMMREETPRMTIVLVWHEHAHSSLLIRSRRHVLLPDDTQKQRAG